MLRRVPWFEIILVTILMGIAVYGAFSDAQSFSRNWFTRDDAYYYFKVAQNISEGHGSTFDGVNPTNGYHPLWLLACIPIFALARFDLILPLRVLFVVMGMLNAATCILLYRLMKRVLSPAIAALAVIFWGTDYTIQTTMYQQGLETGLAAFCVALLLYVLAKYEGQWSAGLASKKGIAIMACLAVLVMFSRLDLVFLAALIGLRVVFRKTGMGDLVSLDLLILLTSAASSFIIRIGLPEYYDYSSAAMTMALISIMVRIPIFYFFGLYDHSKRPPVLIRQSLLAVPASSVIVGALMIPLARVLHLDAFPRIALLYDMALVLLMILSSRLGAHWFSSTRIREETRPIATLRQNWRRWLADGAVYYGILLGALAVYMVLNLMMFKTTSPVSGQIKRWWGSHESLVYGGAARTKLDFFAINPETDFNAWVPFTWRAFVFISNRWPFYVWFTWWQTKYVLGILGIFLVSFALLALNPKYTARSAYTLGIIPLIAASGIQVLAYNMNGYAGVKDWYWIAQYIVILLGAALFIDLFARHSLNYKSGSVFLWLISAALGINMLVPYVNYIRSNMPYGYYKADVAYMDAVPFLEAHTEPGALIGMTGGGNAGYFIHERTIVNMDGLINSYDYFTALQSGHAADYFAEHGLDYIFANPDIVEGAPYRGQFTGRYTNIDRYGGKVLAKFNP